MHSRGCVPPAVPQRAHDAEQLHSSSTESLMALKHRAQRPGVLEVLGHVLETLWQPVEALYVSKGGGNRVACRLGWFAGMSCHTVGRFCLLAWVADQSCLALCSGLLFHVLFSAGFGSLPPMLGDCLLQPKLSRLSSGDLGSVIASVQLAHSTFRVAVVCHRVRPWLVLCRLLQPRQLSPRPGRTLDPLCCRCVCDVDSPLACTFHRMCPSLDKSFTAPPPCAVAEADGVRATVSKRVEYQQAANAVASARDALTSWHSLAHRQLTADLLACKSVS